MGKLNGLRIVEIPKFKAIQFGPASNDEIFGGGNPQIAIWMQKNKYMLKTGVMYEHTEFAWHVEDKTIWIWAVEDWVTEKDTAPFALVEFEGGIYVVGVADENDEEDRGAVGNQMAKWIEDSEVFERDEPGHLGMGNRIGGGLIEETLGMAQQEIFFRVRVRAK